MTSYVAIEMATAGRVSVAGSRGRADSTDLCAAGSPGCPDTQQKASASSAEV